MVFAIEFDPGSFLMVALIGVATVTLMLRLHIVRRKQQLRDAKPAAAPQPRMAQMPHEMLRWQTEIYDFTRDAQARLDNKIAMLQQLLMAADERIARLTTLESQRLQSPTRAAPAGDVDHDAARYAVVFGMADAGNSSNAIAGRLGIPLGEIELMLSLRRRIPERRSA